MNRQIRVLVLLFLSTVSICRAQFAVSFTKISSTSGGFTGTLNNDAKFGIKSDAIGDLDNDGVQDVVVGATNQGGNRGSIFILFMKPDGSVKKTVEIISPEPGDLDSFGSSVAGLGDLDGDGTEDIAAGAGYDDETGSMVGAVWILFLNADGTVKAKQKINPLHGNFSGPLPFFANFGTGMIGIGDLDGDGVKDLAVGADRDDGSTSTSGAVYILFLNATGTVKSHRKISGGLSGFVPSLSFEDYFGYGLGVVGDLDTDGVPELAIGAHRTDDGGTNRGAVYIAFLTSAGTVKKTTKISALGGGFIDNYTSLGVDIAGVGDIDGDGVKDIVVGGNDSNNDGGAIWYLMLKIDGTVKSSHKISNSSGGTNLSLDPGDFFGGSILSLGDINGDGRRDIGVGAFNDDDGGTDRGAFWVSVGCEGASHAGNDQNLCATQSATLEAEPSQPGHWVLYKGGGTIVDSGDPNTLVTNLSQGVNEFIWQLPTSFCIREDTVRLTVSSGLSAGVVNDKVYTCDQNAIVEAVPIEAGVGKWLLVSGNAIIESPGDIKTAVHVTTLEPVVIVWQVTEPGCETKEASTTIFPFEITEADIPNVITPNGDGRNETWQILRDKPRTVSVRILNRWGRIVFEASPYTNNWSAPDLSEGVYFYRLSVSGCDTEFKGSLQIIR